MATMGKVLVVAGSDPSGGAGLEADQKVLAAHKCYAMTATTALTVQNTKGVTGVHIVPADFVASQIEAVAADIDIDVLKTGMLGSEETIIALAEKIVKLSIPIVVVDPVMVSTSGSQLLPQSAVQTLSTHLLPHTTLLTPNIPEAILILKQNGRPVPDIKSVADMEVIGRELQKLGPKWVLVKGGHVPLKSDLTTAETDADRVFVVDVLVGPEDLVVKIQASWQESTSTHGTGCSLASAISANLSNKMGVPSAVRSACRYVEAGIKTAPRIGQGNGPLNHFHSVSSLPFSPGYFIEYLLSRADVCIVWDEFVYHPFVMGLGNGSLPLDSFKGYIIQDYLYLVHFSRANALAAYKSTNIRDIARSTEIVNHIAREMDLHIGYCKTFGISEAEIAATTELQACTAYTRYVLDIGMSQDWLALQMALAPCLLGYGAVAQMLLAHKDTVKDPKSNIYWAWIENYAAEDYTEAVRLGSELIETHIRTCSPARVEELIQIFIHATRMEIGFWEMFPAT